MGRRVGGESGQGTRPMNRELIFDIRDQSLAAGVLGPLPGLGLDGIHPVIELRPFG